MIAFLNWFRTPRPEPITDYEMLDHQLALVHAEAQLQDKHNREFNRWIAKNTWDDLATFINDTRAKQDARTLKETQK